jgi:hypothetical protein
MSVSQQAVRYGQRRALRRLSRAVPWVGTVIVLATIGAAMRRKGVIKGALDSALNAAPVVGPVKAVCEVIRGRDFFPDRIRPVAR